MMLTSFILLSLALVLCDPCFAVDSPLIGKSFKVRTRIYRPSSSTKLELLLEESYSRRQNRANIKVHEIRLGLTSNPDPKEFHYNGFSENGLLYSPAQDSCDRADLVQFYTTSLHFKFDFSRLLQMEISKSSPVIGPARLLVLVASRSDLLKNPAEQLVNGIPTIKYTVNIPLAGEGQSSVELQVFYEKSTHQPDKLAEQIPIFIVWQTLWLHFYQLELSHTEQITSLGYLSEASTDSDQSASDILWDEFILPTNSKCVQLLGKYNIYSTFDMHSLAFSFEAETLDSSGFLQHHWVQYDGMLQALRVDSHEHAAPGELKSAIINLRKDRRYLITGGPNDKEAKKCLVMKNLGKWRANLRSSNLLIGEGQLASLGKAVVRGVAATVYGTLSDELPFWFEQPVLYQRDSIGEVLRRRGQPAENPQQTSSKDNLVPGMKEKDNSTTQAPTTKSYRYKMLAYFDEGHNNRPLALDIYDLLGDESQRLLRIRFRDFVWQLSEAPDGSQANEVFALADVCSARPKDDSFLEVNLLLRQDEISGAGSLTRGTWLQDWPARDSSLLAGLTDSLDLDSSMIHDLESLVSERDHKIALEVHFRLAEQIQLLHNFKLIGPANLKPASNSMREIKVAHKGSALLLTDCLSLAARNNQIKISPTYVYYSEQHFACLIDPTLDGADQSDLTKSPIIELISEPANLATGELYRVDTHLDYSTSTGMVQEKRLAALEDRILLLTHTTGRPAQPLDPAVFRMRIKRVEINNNNYHSLNSANQRASYEGFAFANDGKFNRLVEPDDERAPSRFSQCQAACLADYRCAAFSYCIRFPGSECMLSEVFNLELGKNLTKSAQAGATTSRLITIQTDEYGEVRLRRDARCELNRKAYLSQFVKGGKEKNVLAGHWTIPVSNSEECAQSCFMKTLKLIKSMSHETGRMVPDHIRQVCTRFLYINSLLSEAQADALREAIDAPEFDVHNHSGGFCLIKHDLNMKTKASHTSSVFFNFDYYDLDFSTLYEKTHDLSLLDTSNDAEKAAQSRLAYRTAQQEDYDLLEKADRDDRNIQSKVAGISEQLCARKCLTQATPLIPACRSFDIVRIDRPALRRPYIICLFNTKLANQTEHHNSQNFSSVEDRWHYEPRWDLFRRAIEAESQSIASTNRRCSEYLGGECNQYGFLKGTSIVIGVMILAKISGFVLGIGLTKKILNLRESGSQGPARLCTDCDGGIALE